MQLIYCGKTEQSLPRFKFPEEFSSSVNPTHYSNSAESIKLMEDIIVPYLQKERTKLELAPTHKGLLIMDVFTGQMTSDVGAVLNENNICVVKCSTKHDEVLPTIRLNCQWTCKTLFEK